MTKKISTYQNILWDWNGTLLNDPWLCIKIVNIILQKQHLPILTYERYRDIFGFPIYTYYSKLGIDFNVESFEELTKFFITSYENEVEKCELHHEVISVLRNAKTLNKNQFILTASHENSMAPLLNYYEISSFFHGIYGLQNHKAASKVERGKQLMNEKELDPKTTLMIGDTDHDYEVALALGIDSVLIAQGHQSFKKLKSCGVPNVIHNLMELL